MASVTLTINYPDGQGANLLAAMQAEYGMFTDESDPDPANWVTREYTLQEILDMEEERIRKRWRWVYKKHQEDQQPAVEELDAT